MNTEKVFACEAKAMDFQKHESRFVMIIIMNDWRYSHL